MTRTRYGCRVQIQPQDQLDNEPAILMQCPRCDEYIRTLIAEMIELSKDEYQRGWRDGVRALQPQGGKP